MNDRPITPEAPEGGPDPVVTAALESMVPPEHGAAFWDRLDTLIADGPATAPNPVVSTEPPQPPPPLPPLAEVVPLPLPAPRPRPYRWLIPAAAVLVVALATVALVRTTSTDVETTAPASDVPVETSVAPTTTAPAPPPVAAPAATATVPQTAKPTVPPTTLSRSTTTTRPASLTLSPAGLGPLRLGMTAQQAEATGAVGPFQDPLDTGGACGDAAPAGTYRAGDFGALFLDGRLARIYVSQGSRLRTPQGLGVGSAASKLSSVPGTRVESPHPYGGGTNVDITTGDVGYQFTVSKGIVTAWSVGTKQGLSLTEGCA